MADGAVESRDGRGVLRSGRELLDEPARDAGTESRLVEAAKRDPDALAQLYRHYQPLIARHVLRRVGQPAVAEDVGDTMAEDLARYGAIGPSDVQAVALEWLPADRRVELVVEPEAAKETAK